MSGEADLTRSVLEIRGGDREVFLQGLVSQDVKKLKEGAVYAALLTPQGKYLADFFLVPWGEAILIDADADQAGDLLRRLSMYRLRADVQIAQSPLRVSRGLGAPPEGAFADPRHPALGWRLYSETPGAAPGIDWDALRVAHVIPAAGVELVPNDTYILEAGFERLAGVDFRKGCYVGQEVTARMKHKTELRKGFVRVELEGPAATGDTLFAGDKEAGTLFTIAGRAAIAWLRFDRAQGELRTGSGVAVRLAQAI